MIGRKFSFEKGQERILDIESFLNKDYRNYNNLFFFKKMYDLYYQYLRDKVESY